MIQSMPHEGKKLAVALLSNEHMNEYGDDVLETEHQTQTIVICPTHEHCQLLKEEFVPICDKRNLSVIKVHGGLSITSKTIQQSDVIIACPGRFKYECRDLDQSQLKLIVIYNQDILMNESKHNDFQNDIKQIIKDLNIGIAPNVHVLGISNTMNDGANDMMRDIIFENVNRTFRIEGMVNIPKKIILQNPMIKHYIIDKRRYHLKDYEIITRLVERILTDQKVPVFVRSNENVRSLKDDLRESTKYKRDIIPFGKWIFGDIQRNEKFEDASSRRERQRHKERLSCR